jgi:DNA-binding beta-propeller fold protein YncE
MRRLRAVTVLAAVAAVVATPTVANAGPTGGGTVAQGLQGPRQLNSYVHGKLVVAESDSGEVSSVDPRTGTVRTLVGGLPTPQGVDYRDGLLFIATGEEAPPPDAATTATTAGQYAPRCNVLARPEKAASSLLVATPQGRIVKRYDLLCYELKNNPDRQRQFDPQTGAPLDALSNPFAVHVQKNRILVADAGANAVLQIDRRTNRVSTFFVPPLVPPSVFPDCALANVPQGKVGCDPVPTGVTEDRHGNIYVSTLGGEAPTGGRVFVLSPSGKVLRVIKDLPPLTGIAVDGSGNVYVSALFGSTPPTGPEAEAFAALEEEPPAAPGEIIRITRSGDRTSVAVPLPTGLELCGRTLFASALSLVPDAGQVVAVPTAAFNRQPV